jgi:hypothetical protein
MKKEERDELKKHTNSASTLKSIIRLTSTKTSERSTFSRVDFMNVIMRSAT